MFNSELFLLTGHTQLAVKFGLCPKPTLSVKETLFNIKI